MRTKTCTGCKLTFPIKQFSFDKNRPDGRCYYCKECYIINERRQRINYADRRAHLLLMRQYGISLEEFKQRALDQNSLCAICHKPDPEGERLSVDHDHITNKVRGLLCKPCNTMLGGAHDDILILKEGIEYLNQFKLSE